jgi:hypothetical protein
MSRTRLLVLILGLATAAAVLVGPSASAGSGKAAAGPSDLGPNAGPNAGTGADVFNATDWFVSNTVGVGTDTPDDDLEIEKASFPFLEIDATSSGNAGVVFDNPAGAIDCIFADGTTGDLRFTDCFGNGMSLDQVTSFLGVGNTNPLTQLHVGSGSVPAITAGASLMVQQGSASSMILKSTTGTESFFYQDVNNGLFGTATNTPMGIRTNNANRMWITNDGLIGIGTNFPTSTLHVIGSLNVTGTKNFVQKNPENAKQDIVYAALEGPEAGTYTRGSGTLVNGVARISLPHHFGLVTERKSLTVQLTPRGSWSQLYVERLSPTELVVRSANGKTGQFDFLVQGVRKGFSDFKVVRGAREVTK